MRDNVEPINISDEMRQSYLSYAMSVIVSRALPDARDGLKPVQRRVLYAMHDMGLRPDRTHKKSARVVGEVLGKYHPHGDQSVYDAMVRMAQDFSLRYPLVDGQGNFGSIDGDGAAAMRYTEAKMSPIGFDMLTDLEKDTVDFGTNFDDTLKEPLVLPAAIPSLLVNGSTGIAVGMSTSIPPHNLGEVSDALVFMLDNWKRSDDVSVNELLQYIKGPDFPTGGMIFRHRDDVDVMTKAYSTGRGRVTVRASAEIETMERNKSRIIITELPYQVNKTNLLTKIADLHRDAKLEGLTDLRDESDRNGMRIVIETTRTVAPEDVLRRLYKLTPMESTFSIIMLALVDGEPRVLTLKQTLRIFLDHRLEIVRRRSEYDLAKAQGRAHILEGLLKALDHLDDVISIIRKSRTVETARANLIKRFKFSEIQASAILDMQLRRLAALERRKLQEEYDEIMKEVKYLKKLLSKPELMRGVIREELLEMRSQYVDVRRTLIVEKAPAAVLTSADLIQDEKVWVVIGEDGTVARTQSAEMVEIPGRPKEQPKALIAANTRDILYLVAANGEAVSRRVYDLHLTAKLGEGIHWTEGCGFASSAHLAAAFILPENLGEDMGYICLATLGSAVKRVRVSDLPTTADQPFTLMRVDEADSLGWARWTSGNDDLLLATAYGQLIRFSENDVRPSGLKAGGVAGMKLKSEADGIVGMDSINPQISVDKNFPLLVWSITDNGMAKATLLEEYPQQKRHGQGVSNMKLPEGADEVVSMLVGDRRTEIYVNSQRGNTKRMRIAKAGEGKRTMIPREVLSVSESNRVTGVVHGTAAADVETAVDPQQLSLI